MAVVAMMPSARDRTATAVNPGFLTETARGESNVTERLIEPVQHWPYTCFR